jgi:two-component system, OmpR family, response regulator
LAPLLPGRPSQQILGRGEHNGGVWVLLVEDEQRLAAAIERGLVAEGFEVDVVDNGADGLWRAREGTYSAILLDILLPGLNGYEVCRTLRADNVWTPILMLTAKDGEYDEVEAFELGADDFLSKPFSFPVLVARLRSLVRRGQRARPERLVVDDLTLDPSARHCERHGDRINLTPREFALLEVLMRNAGDVLSKPELLDAVWGIDFEGDPNVVEVYIGYLRRKLDKPYGRATFETVRGSGYRLAGHG